MKKTTIIINGQAFTYDDEIDDITYDNSKPLSYDDAKELLSLTKKLFVECGISFSLAYGTLLGAVREHGLIPGDDDIDLMSFDEETLYNSLPYLSEHGLKVCRIHPYVYSFKNGKDCYIDVYPIRKFHGKIWKLWCYDMINKAIPKRFFKRFEEIEFLGDKYNIPADYDGILTSWYDKNWRIPVHGHGLWIVGEKSYHYWKIYYPRFKERVKKLILWRRWRSYVVKKHE